MLLLAIDTSTEFCSIALWQDEKVVSWGELAAREHAQKLLPQLDQLLVSQSVQLRDIDYFVVGRGPGSFTGVRIASSVAQGLAYSQNKPLIGVSSLQALAQEAHDVYGVQQAVVALDARIQEVYFCAFKAVDGVMQAQGTEQVVAPEHVELQSYFKANQHPENGLWYAVGSGFLQYEQLGRIGEALEGSQQAEFRAIRDQLLYPKASFMFAEAKQRIEQQSVAMAADFRIHYVRNEVAWQKLPGRT